MSRLIDADALKEKLSKGTIITDDLYGMGIMAGVDHAIKILADAPTIEAEPVVHAKWVDRYGEKYDNHLYECSACRKKALYDFKRDMLGREHAVQVLSDACPHCRAKMDKEDA